MRNIIAAILLIYLMPYMMGQELASATNKKNVTFSIYQGIGGCSTCENAIREMLNDVKKRAELIKILPQDSTVVFYVREPKNDTKITKGTIGIIVGSCASDLQSKGSVYVPGCRRQIDSDAIYRAIIAKRESFAPSVSQKADSTKKGKSELVPTIATHKKPVEPVESVESVEPVEPVEPVDSVDSKHPSICKLQAETGITPKTCTCHKWRPIAFLVLAMSLWSVFVFVTKPKRGSVWIMALAVLGYFGFYRGGCPCPLGTIGNMVLSMTNGALNVGLLAFVFFIVPLLFTIFFGRVFCSSACPMGAIQELVSWKHVQLPRRIEYILRFGKHLTLFIIIFAAVKYSNGLLFCKWEPFVSIFQLSGSTVAFAIAFIFLAVSVFIDRPFCRWLCPYAVLLGIVSPFSIKKRHIVTEKCIECELCEKVCPMQCVKIPDIDLKNCIMCDKCRAVCPKDAIK